MKKYFFRDGTGQYGPFNLDELKDKNIIASTPVWHEGLDEWTTAGQVEELKDIIVPAAMPETNGAEQVAATPETSATVSSAVTATQAVSPTASAPVRKTTTTPKKGSAWITWVLSLLVIGGAGYFVYQDMEKNKDASGKTIIKDTADMNKPDNPSQVITATRVTADTITPQTDTGAVISITPVTVTTVTAPSTTNDPAAIKKAEEEKKKKAAEEKKKKLAAEAKKKEDELKKQVAAQAAKEAEMRNNWSKYITIGGLNYKEDDGIKAFPVPLYNAATAVLDRVTLRVDYLKKEGKLVSSETLVLNNIPAKGRMDATATGNKKAKKVNVYITGITSKKLHFCYPVNNGNPADPYFCN